MHDGTLCSLIVLTYSGRISHVKTWKFPCPSGVLFWQNKHLWVCISQLPNVTHRFSDRGRQWAVTDMISNHTTCRLVIRLLGCIIIFGYAFNSSCQLSQFSPQFANYFLLFCNFILRWQFTMLSRYSSFSIEPAIVFYLPCCWSVEYPAYRINQECYACTNDCLVFVRSTWLLVDG